MRQGLQALPICVCVALLQGIGRATALLFARKGYNVVVAARDATKLAYVVEDCAKVRGGEGTRQGYVTAGYRQGAAGCEPTAAT